MQISTIMSGFCCPIMLTAPIIGLWTLITSLTTKRQECASFKAVAIRTTAEYSLFVKDFWRLCGGIWSFRRQTMQQRIMSFTKGINIWFSIVSMYGSFSALTCNYIIGAMRILHNKWIDFSSGHFTNSSSENDVVLPTLWFVCQ